MQREPSLFLQTLLLYMNTTLLLFPSHSEYILLYNVSLQKIQIVNFEVLFP